MYNISGNDESHGEKGSKVRGQRLKVRGRVSFQATDGLFGKRRLEQGL